MGLIGVSSLASIHFCIMIETYFTKTSLVLEVHKAGFSREGHNFVDPPPRFDLWNTDRLLGLPAIWFQHIKYQLPL